MKGIADTGLLVAFLNRRDRHHAWAVEVARGITDPLLTCDAVLAEAAFHLQNTESVLALAREGMILPAFDVLDHLPRLSELARRYRDRQPDLADLCLIRMTEMHPEHRVFTIDVTDFRVYRRNRREVIPLVHPPNL